MGERKSREELVQALRRIDTPIDAGFGSKVGLKVTLGSITLHALRSTEFEMC